MVNTNTREGDAGVGTDAPASSQSPTHFRSPLRIKQELKMDGWIYIQYIYSVYTFLLSKYSY